MTKKILVGVGVAAVLGAVLFFSLRGDEGRKGARVYAESVERRAISRIVKELEHGDPVRVRSEDDEDSQEEDD